MKQNVVVAGYSTFAWALVLQLRGRIAGRLYFVLPDRDLALEASVYADVVAVHGEMTDTAVLDDLGLAQCHTFIAASREEQANVLAALYAQNHGARHVYARVFETKFMALLEAVGVTPLQTSQTAAAFTAVEILQPAVAELVSLTRGQFALEEIEASDYAELIGCRLGHLQGESLHIIAVAQNGAVSLAYNTVIQADALLILICNQQIKRRLPQELRKIAGQAAKRGRGAGS